MILCYTIEQHKKIIVPGIFSIQNGVKVYIPISKEQYNEMLENGNIENLAYNTYSMGTSKKEITNATLETRTIFTQENIKNNELTAK